MEYVYYCEDQTVGLISASFKWYSTLCKFGSASSGWKNLKKGAQVLQLCDFYIVAIKLNNGIITDTEILNGVPTHVRILEINCTAEIHS